MVQIRDENHRPLPGIEVGDLGPKLGDHANDTGFLRLDNVRVPRENMLSKYQQVDEDGNYVKAAKEGKGNDKLHYATMMFARGGLVMMASGHLAKAVTIATRYSAVRKQGFEDTKSSSFRAPEKQIIDHQVQQYRLMKQLSIAYAFRFCSRWLINKQSSVRSSIGEIIETDDLKDIAETSAALKGLCTQVAADGIEDCRKCCGGNGYLLSSGIGALALDYLWQTTAEGDFVVMLLHTAHFLIKNVRKVRNGENVYGPCDYMMLLQNPQFNVDYVLSQCQIDQPNEHKKFSDLQYLLSVFKARALVYVADLVASLDAQLSSGVNYDQAFNNNAVLAKQAVIYHCYYFVLSNFISCINDIEDVSVKKVLENVCAFFACTNLLDNQMAGFLNHKSVNLLSSNIVDLLKSLRPNAVTLVDSFDFPDRVLNSSIGRYDGNIYESLYMSAVKSNLNKTDPFIGYEQVLKPRLDGEMLKEGADWVKSKL
eukprot:TRINITY_DN494_c0_g3_i1.p1 TRINITY_DN494_c0_g3~~TRINITY_DN494_c0_g3_i1.p1  ORF type:complete len:482 (-),score=120.82 TRINITY_DN494_c0_g3_i1:88-1533(-)